MAVVLTLMGGTSAWSTVHVFPEVICLGANETPPVASTGVATAEVVYNDATNTLYWTVDYVLDVGSTTLTDAHFHGPAAPGVPAGVQVPMSPSVSTASGSFSGMAVISGAQEADLLAGLYYINLHSNVETGGELRGQVIEAAATKAYADRPVDSSQETSGVSGTPGSGVFNGAYDEATNRMTFAVTWNALTGAVTGMHFHGPGAVGVPADIEIPLSGFDAADTGIFADSVTLNATQETDLLADLWYINLHTSLNPSGEVRGQIDNAVTVPVELSVFTAD